MVNQNILVDQDAHKKPIIYNICMNLLWMMKNDQTDMEIYILWLLDTLYCFF